MSHIIFVVGCSDALLWQWPRTLVLNCNGLLMEKGLMTTVWRKGFSPRYNNVDSKVRHDQLNVLWLYLRVGMNFLSVFSKCGFWVLWPNTSKRHCFRSFVDCSNVTFQTYFFLGRSSIPLLACPNQPYFFSLFSIILSWTFTFDILPEACGVWELALRLCCRFSKRCMVWPWMNLMGPP